MPYNNLQSIPVFDRWFGSWQVRIGRRPLAPDALAMAYNKHAPTWTQLTNRLGYPASYRLVFDQFLGQHASQLPTSNLHVLDCGVGTGSFSLALHNAWKKPMTVSAVDISSAMADTSAMRFRSAGIPADVRVASVSRLPFDDNQFDLVIAAHVLEHLPNPIEALAEMRRVLRPGGWIVSCLTRRSWLGTYIQTKWRTHRVSESEARSWLQQAGFNPGTTSDRPGGLFRLTSLAAFGQNTASAETNQRIG
ncbi:MAG: class I SAM-dependent methyltransferase [Pseudomonadota bacterium]